MVTNVLINVKINAAIAIATERKPMKSKDNFATLFNIMKIMPTTRGKINLSWTNIYELKTDVGNVRAIERTDRNISFLAMYNLDDR